MANNDKKAQPQDSMHPQDPMAQAQAQPSLGADGKPVQPVSPGDEPRAGENKSSTGQGTTQADADKAAAGNYRVLEPITYSGSSGEHTKANPGDIVFLNAQDAKGLLTAKAVESADTSGADQKAGSADPRKIQ